MNKTLVTFFTTCMAVIFFLQNSHAQPQTVEFDQLDSLLAVKQKKVVVFIHTDWCKYCLQMENTTFKNDRVINTLNNHFYFINLNAESTEDINYGGHTFKYKPTGRNTGVHELAEQLGTINGTLNYPTLSVINAENEIVFQYGSFMKPDALLMVLKKLK